MFNSLLVQSGGWLFFLVGECSVVASMLVDPVGPVFVRISSSGEVSSVFVLVSGLASVLVFKKEVLPKIIVLSNVSVLSGNFVLVVSVVIVIRKVSRSPVLSSMVRSACWLGFDVQARSGFSSCPAGWTSVLTELIRSMWAVDLHSIFLHWAIVPP